jgi:hypothetical protein
MYEPILRRLVGDDYELSGDEARLLCPVHEARTGKPDHKPSFYFNVESGLCFCFSCGYRANAYLLWRDLKGEDLEIDEEIEPDEQISALRRRLERVPIRELYVPTVMDEADLDSFQRPNVEMLESRGISKIVAEMLEIRSSGGAWILPVRHITSGILMGIQIKDGKYVRNAPVGIKKGLSLFGLNTEYEHNSDAPTLVVESPLDVAVCFTHGLQAVATYGANVTEYQMQELKRMNHLVLAFDNDDAGREVTKEVEQALLTVVSDHRSIVWPDGIKDPGDARAKMRELTENAPSRLAERMRRFR